MKGGFSHGKTGGFQNELIDNEYLLNGHGVDYAMDYDANEEARTNEELFEEAQFYKKTQFEQATVGLKKQQFAYHYECDDDKVDQSEGSSAIEGQELQDEDLGDFMKGQGRVQVDGADEDDDDSDEYEDGEVDPNL